MIGVAAVGALVLSRPASAAEDVRTVTDDKGQRVPRGIKNNNPFNLRPLGAGRTWQGQAGVDAGNYCVFKGPADGLRAGFKNLRNQQVLHGLNTVRDIITKYAPASDDNDTEAYIADVADVLGVADDEPLDLVKHVEQLRLFGAAIIRHENGVQPYAPYELERAAAQAGGA